MSMAAITGDYADLKSVKTRSVVQIIIECPIEQGEAIVKMFGFPQPGKPVSVAIARLAEQCDTTTNKAGESKREWRDLSPAQQAGIRCNEPRFQTFLREIGDASCRDAESAATYVRFACGVKSRADLNSATSSARLKWRDLEARYQAWLSDPLPSSPAHEAA